MTDEIKNNQSPDLRRRSIGSIIFRALLCIIIIATGLFAVNYLTRSNPKAHRQAPTKITPRVRVQPVTPTNETVIIQASGTVIPARKITLKSRVAGEVIDTHPDFSPGGFLKKGERVLKVDDTDYQLVLARKQSEVVAARYAIALEKGRQEVARREWALINKDHPADDGDAELALRKPHLEKVLADLKVARIGIKQAQLNIERTRIRAPFNAVILATYVETGSQITVQERIADLVATDEYWVRVSIPVDRLKWISIPANHRKAGSITRVIYHSSAVRTGSVIKLLGDLEPKGRMARLLIAIKDPLGRNHPGSHRLPLLIGEYVRVEIKGKPLNNVYRIPRTALRDGTHLWVVGPGEKLEIRKVETIWRDAEAVFLKTGIQPGDRLIISDLSTPIAGMSVNVVDVDKQVGQ
jgi:RND family efflux transporter MFP subunit